MRNVTNPITPPFSEPPQHQIEPEEEAFSIHLELYGLKENLNKWIKDAESQQNDAKIVALRNVMDEITRIQDKSPSIDLEVRRVRAKLQEEKHAPNFPPELDFAVQAWRAVFTTEGKAKPKARIREWLDENTTLSNAAKERIATVANWDKTGGATRAE